LADILDKFKALGSLKRKDSSIDKFKRNNRDYLKKQILTRKDSKKDSKDPPTKVLPKSDPGFANFCRWLAYPEYGGLDGWQREHEELTKDSKYEMTCVSRDHGKSVKYNWKYQYRLAYKGYDILLLGWTARYKQIALYVYTFCDRYGLIEKDQRTSPFHFRLKNGGRFDCYLITSKETLGMHSEGAQNRFRNLSDEEWEEYKGLYTEEEWGKIVDYYKNEDADFDENNMREYLQSREGSTRKLWISIDDPIDISFMKERHKEDMLELRFNSTLYSINPDNWSFTGTRKFEGDFFDFIEDKFGDKLVKYIRGPINPDGSLLCPERFTHPSLSTYKEDLKRTDERPPKKDLQEIRESIGEYAWFSDWCQKPHPITGEVWDTMAVVDFLEHPYTRHYPMLWITIDRATTRKTQAVKSDADYTGCILGLREFDTGRCIITDDWTGYIDVDELLFRVNMYIIEFHLRYEHIELLQVVETQGGGQDYVTFVYKLPEFTTENKELIDKVLESKVLREFLKHNGTYDKAKGIMRLPNKIREWVTTDELHNKGEKIPRIRDRLNVPMKTKSLVCMHYMLNSEVVKELRLFPHCRKLDAPDAMANLMFRLVEAYPIRQRNTTVYSEIQKLYEDFAEGKLEELEDPNKPFLNPLDRIFEKDFGVRRRRTVFE